MEKIKVLIVNDDPGIRADIILSLNNFKVDFPFSDEVFGFETIETSTAEDAIRILSEKSIDIVMVDNILPRMSGMELLEYITKNVQDIRVLMIAPHASLDLAVQATSKGAYDFIPVPFTPKEIKSAIENVTKNLFLMRMTQNMHREGKMVRFKFLSLLSHELKAPLNAIQGYLEMMQTRQFGDSLNDYETIIDRSLTRIKGMRHLIMDLLDLTKIESGKGNKRRLDKINVIDIAKTSLETLHPFAIQKDVDVKLNYTGDVFMCADSKEIEIIFNNLISNAIKYNNNGGKVDITIDKTTRNVIITVSDNGFGMNPEDMSKLFSEFFRIKNDKTKNINGSGLGLSIIKKITDMYAGEVKVASTPNEGSTFTVTLPK